MTPKCGSCGSPRVLREMQLITQAFMGPYRISVRGPVTSTLRRHASSDLAAEICIDCGRVELRAMDLSGLKQAYDALARPALGLDD